MERHEIDRLECEANGHTPPHILAKRKEEILKVTIQERMQEVFDHVEPWQNYGVFWLLVDLPKNTFR